MNIVLTGSTGFLGGVIHKMLAQEHSVTGIGRAESNAVICDLADEVPQLPECDMIIHCAGKAHSVPSGDAGSREFYNVNVKGTANLLAGAERLKIKPSVIVFISSVSVYGMENGDEIDESHPLNASDPYGRSKIEAEKVVTEWGYQHGVNIVILRLPLVAGPNPPGNLGAMIKAIRTGYYFRIGDGSARRSMVKAVDVALLLPRLIHHRGVYNLCGSVHPSISDVDSLIAGMLNRKVSVISLQLANVLAVAGNIIPFFPFNKRRLSKLTSQLTFSDKKARVELGWNPTMFSEKDFSDF